MTVPVAACERERCCCCCCCELMYEDDPAVAGSDVAD